MSENCPSHKVPSRVESWKKYWSRLKSTARARLCESICSKLKYTKNR